MATDFDRGALAKAKARGPYNVDEIRNLTPQQRARIFAEIEAETPEERRTNSKPLNAEERAWWTRVQKKTASAGEVV